MTNEIKKIGVHEGYELWARTYDETPNPIVAMDARHAMRVLEPQPGELVLDAGCGTGRNLGSISETGARVIGVDFSAGMLGVAREAHPEASLAVVDVQTTLPFADGAFDAVLCSLVGEHLAELPRALSEMRRVIRSGGRMVFTVYHPTLAEAGVEANFRREGIEYRLSAELYSVQDYLDITMDAGFDELAFAEFRGDERLAAEVVEAEKYIGKQVLLLIAAVVM